MTSLTPYSESLERVRSVLVFFATTGAANAAVLAELESEVRIATAAARQARLALPDFQADLDRMAAVTLPSAAAASASRLMAGWAASAFARMPGGRSEPGAGRDGEARP